MAGETQTWTEVALGVTTANSPAIRVRGPWSLTTYGTWSGEVRVNRTIYATGVIGDYPHLPQHRGRPAQRGDDRQRGQGLLTMDSIHHRRHGWQQQPDSASGVLQCQGLRVGQNHRLFFADRCQRHGHLGAGASGGDSLTGVRLPSAPRWDSPARSACMSRGWSLAGPGRGRLDCMAARSMTSRTSSEERWRITLSIT